MPAVRAVVVAAEMVTPYGWGVDACWAGLMAGRTAISRVARFDTRSFQSGWAGLVPGLEYGGSRSIVMQMIEPLLGRLAPAAPPDAPLILATTVGEIDLLEQAVLGRRVDGLDRSRPDRLLEAVGRLCGTRGPGLVISAACASGTAALAH